MPAPSALPFIVAGGGIGGLAAALGLARKGIPVLVLEKATVLGEIGAGIQLGPNAFHCFDDLGIGEAARAMAVFIDNLRLMDATTAEEITRIPLDEPFRRRFGNPYAVVHRGDLHGVFLRACRGHAQIELRAGCEVVGYDQDGATVTARLAAGGVMVLSLEAITQPTGTGWRLGRSGRYAHTPECLAAAVMAAGLTIRALDRETLRTEDGAPVPGLVATLAR